MNKIIRRFAIVAVAAMLCSGPGLAWGALVLWDGTGFDHTIKLTDTTTGSATLVRDTLDLTPLVDGKAGFTADHDINISSNVLVADPLDSLAVKIPWASTPTDVYAWGAMFQLVQDLPTTVTFGVLGQNSFDVDLPAGDSGQQLFFGWAGFQIDAGTFTDFNVSVGSLIGASTPVAFMAPKFDTQRTPSPSVPEPTTLATWSLLGLIGLSVVRRRRRV